MSSTTPARPRPRAFWADARFLLGIALVLVSIGGVWLVVAAARQTVPVFAADATLVAGEPVSSDDLRVVEVALGQVAEAYAAPGTLEPGAIATRTIAAGELVPLDALGDADRARTTTVVLGSMGDVPVAIEKGSVVEVWNAPRVDQSTYDAPRVLVSAATVVSVTRDDSVVGDTAVTLELVVGREEVPAILAAVAARDSLAMVPAVGAIP